jgi:hypothetical protein
MKKFLTLLTAAAFFINFSTAQVTDKEGDLKKISSDTTDGWEKGGMFSVTFGQAAFSTYWAAGGINSVSVNGIAGLYANYKKGKLAWDNTLDLGYGKQRQGKGDNVDLLKTDDKIDFASKLGMKANDKLYYAVLANFKTQFEDGYNYPDTSTVISSFLAPGYLLFAAGIDYKPNKYITAFIAPVTSKTTFVNNTDLSNAGAFGVEPGKKVRSEFGGYVRTAFAKDIVKNVNLTTKLDLFSNYLNNPQNIDVNWELLIGMKVNKYITANITGQLIYDHDIKFQIVDDNGIAIPGSMGPRTQFKELIAVGFSYKF